MNKNTILKNNMFYLVVGGVIIILTSTVSGYPTTLGLGVGYTVISLLNILYN